MALDSLFAPSKNEDTAPEQIVRASILTPPIFTLPGTTSNLIARNPTPKPITLNRLPPSKTLSINPPAINIVRIPPQQRPDSKQFSQNSIAPNLKPPQPKPTIIPHDKTVLNLLQPQQRIKMLEQCM